MVGSAANRRVQKPWVKITAGGEASLPWPSAGLNERPKAGSTPRNAKKFWVTGTLVKRSGSPAPVSSLSPT